MAIFSCAICWPYSAHIHMVSHRKKTTFMLFLRNCRSRRWMSRKPRKQKQTNSISVGIKISSMRTSFVWYIEYYVEFASCSMLLLSYRCKFHIHLNLSMMAHWTMLFNWSITFCGWVIICILMRPVIICVYLFGPITAYVCVWHKLWPEFIGHIDDAKALHIKKH